MGRIAGKSTTLDIGANEDPIAVERWYVQHTTERAFTTQDVYELIATLKLALECNGSVDVSFRPDDGDTPYLEVTVR